MVTKKDHRSYGSAAKLCSNWVYNQCFPPPRASLSGGVGTVDNSWLQTRTTDVSSKHNEHCKCKNKDIYSDAYSGVGVSHQWDC